MIRLVQIALLLAIVIPFGVLTANAQSVGTLMQHCEIYEKDATISGEGTRIRRNEAGVCLGYFMAVKGTSLAVESDDRPIMSVCAPTSSTADQFIRIFMKFARGNPEKHHEDAIVNVWSALIDAFPCGKKQ